MPSTSRRTGRAPPTTNSSCRPVTTTPSTGSTSTPETVDWKLGGTHTPQSLTIVGDPLGGPRRQHDVRVLPNGHITMFDNRTNFTTATVPFATVTGAARFVEYAIDETANTATLVRQISNPLGFFSGATGSARVQPDGGVVICWGALPGTVFSEYDADRSGRVRGAHAGPQLELPHGEGAARLVRHQPNCGPRPAGEQRRSLPALPAALDALRAHVLAHSVKRGDFTLKSGAKSTWFLDTKQTACRPDGIVLVADALLAIVPADATAIGGLTMGADPMAFGVAAIAATRGRQLRSFSVRKEAKDHGVTGRIAGALEPGDRVVVTEDTTTRGTSLMEAVDVVRAFGAEVVLVTVIVDRGGTCAAMCAAAGVPTVRCSPPPTSASTTAPEVRSGCRVAVAA